MLKGTGTSVSHYKYSVNNPTTHAEGNWLSVSHYKYSVNNPTTHAEGNWHKCEPL